MLFSLCFNTVEQQAHDKTGVQKTPPPMGEFVTGQVDRLIPSLELEFPGSLKEWRLIS
jgi:hypothetical protein